MGFFVYNGANAYQAGDETINTFTRFWKEGVLRLQKLLGAFGRSGMTMHYVTYHYLSI